MNESGPKRIDVGGRTVDTRSSIGADKLYRRPIDTVDDVSVPVLELNVRKLDAVAIDSSHAGSILVDIETVGSTSRACSHTGKN